VTTDLQDERLWNDTLTLASPHWINGDPDEKSAYTIRTRYRSDLVGVTAIRRLENGTWQLELKDEVRALTPGQSAVLYDGDRVVGGGVVL
jgi:tRNA-specific 2-thiouridylase